VDEFSCKVHKLWCANYECVSTNSRSWRFHSGNTKWGDKRKYKLYIIKKYSRYRRAKTVDPPADEGNCSINSRMPSARMWRRVALVITDVSEERIASIIRLTRIGELGTTLAVSINYHICLRSVLRLLLTANVGPSSPIIVNVMMELVCSSETSLLTTATRPNSPEYGILQKSFTSPESYKGLSIRSPSLYQMS
jgi:hypothetical protein